MVAPSGSSGKGAQILPEKITERLQMVHEVIRALLERDFTKVIPVHPKEDPFSVLEKDLRNLKNRMAEMQKQNEFAMEKIKEALAEIIGLTNTVKQATESIKGGKFDIPFDADSSISEVRELKKRFQYLISVIRLLSAESMMGG